MTAPPCWHASRAMADYFEAVVAQSGCEAKLCANWITGELSGALNKAGLDITSARLKPNVWPVWSAVSVTAPFPAKSPNKCSRHYGKQRHRRRHHRKQGSSKSPTRGPSRPSSTKSSPTMPNRWHNTAGNDKVFGFFVGQVMKAMPGKANPQQLNELLKAKLYGEKK